MGVYESVIRPPSSPTSVGRYALVLDEAAHSYMVTVQVLMDTPAERDGRSEYNTVSGKYEQDGSCFTFHVERGSACVRSSAWQGKGVEAYRPFPSFTGALEGERMTLNYNGTLELTMREGPTQVGPALIIPDYAMFD